MIIIGHNREKHLSVRLKQQLSVFFKGSHCPLAPPSLHRVTTTTHPQSGAALFSSFSSCHSSSIFDHCPAARPPFSNQKKKEKRKESARLFLPGSSFYFTNLSEELNSRGFFHSGVSRQAGFLYFELRLLSSPPVGDHGRTGCSDPTNSSRPAASDLDSQRDDVPAVDNFITVSIPGSPIRTRTEPVQIRAPRHRQPGHPERGSPPRQTRVLDPVAC